MFYCSQLIDKDLRLFAPYLVTGAPLLVCFEHFCCLSPLK